MGNRKAVFLDLQGTLGGEAKGDILSFTFFPPSVPAIRLLNEAGLLVIVVTNQSHISKGYFSYEEFERRVDDLKQQLAEGGAKLDAIYCCPHARAYGCSCRKPMPGMLLQAQRDLDLNLSGCYVVGDTGASDMAVARLVGCKGVLVRTGFGNSSLRQYRHLWADIEPDFIAQDVLEAAGWIVHAESSSGAHTDSVLF